MVMCSFGPSRSITDLIRFLTVVERVPLYARDILSSTPDQMRRQ